jgi:VCBS repeat-containing protein
MGKYVANVRGYQPFLTVTQLQARLTGVDAYRAGLADPRSYSGPTWAVQLNTPLDSHGPNAVAYARATGSQAAEFDASYSSSWHRITSYAWTFDDGSHASGRVVNHTFSSGGTHRATVAVTSEYGTDSRTVSVDLSGGGSTNHAPVANADGYSVAQGGSLAISSPGVLGNDTDADGDHLTATLVATASHGSLDLDANGGFTYTPNSAYTGADSFTYRANDGTANSNVATVSISVTLSGGGGGDIALHAAATGANTGGSTLVLPRPSGTVSGDVLVAATSVRGIPTITAPSGWTLVRRDAKKTNFSQAVFVHVATGAEPASYTFSFGASGAAVGTIAAYAGVDTASPIAASGGQANGSSTSVTAPSITSGVANTRLVGFFLSATKTAFSAPSGMTERAEAVSPAAATAKLTSELADQAYGPTGATGTRVAIATKAASSVGQLIALRPA